MKIEKPTVDLSGFELSAFSIIGKVRRELYSTGYTRKEIQVYEKEALSGDYENLINVTKKWVNIKY